MRLIALILLVASAPAARAETTEAAQEAHSELEARAEAAPEEAAEQPAEEAAEKPAEEAAEKPSEKPAQSTVARVVDVAAPPVSERNAKLNIGGQVVFALAAEAATMKGANVGDLRTTVDKLIAAGAFSIKGGAWLDRDAVRRSEAALRAALVESGEKLEPLAEVDPTEESAVKGKSKELIEAIDSVKLLVGAGAAEARRGEINNGLADFKLALDPPYAHGQSVKKIAGYSAASVGAMVTMAGIGALSNPLEREMNHFGWYATGIGLTSAGVGVALILLDDR